MHGPLVANALAQMLVGGIVGEPLELILDRFAQNVRRLHNRILGCFGCKLGIEVGDVQDRLNRGLERGLDFLGEESR